MDVRFADDRLRKLEVDPSFTGEFGQDVVRSYRKKMQFIRAATDERAFYAMKSLHFEKLQGKRSHQHSMRLNKRWRLVIEFEKSQSGKVVVVVSIEDYH
jgi:proteic killer suppression protein